MIRCVGAALRGDGNPPEVPVIRTVLRAYNGVWGVPIKHMSAALCAHLGALRPLFLGVEHRGQYEPPQRTEKADVGSRTRTGCVDGTPAVPSRSSDGS